jgi:sterol desaturase/sphingolipid hydroxylase (fatty acid hydroxylase superfamily)
MRASSEQRVGGPPVQRVRKTRLARRPDAPTISAIYSPDNLARVLKGHEEADESARHSSRKASVAFVALLVVSLASYIGGVYVLSAMVRHWPSIGPFIFVDTHGSSSFSFWSAVLQPGAFMAVLFLCLAFEAGSVGLEKSAISRLLAGASASTRVDLFYIAMRFAGGFNVLAFVFSFGSVFWLANQTHRVLHIAFLHHVHSYVIQFGVVYLVNTFLAYWGHRLMHTKWMWEIHKVHHAADEMNLVTSFRNHPIDQIINMLLNAFSVALLGASPAVAIFYYALNTVYQSLVHSEVNLKGRFWDKIWITPAAHRIHHSNRREHWDTNFGILAFWDHLFGTYHPPSNEKLTYGVDGGEDFNRPQYVFELFDNVRRWLRPAWNRLALGKVTHSDAPTSSVSPRSTGNVEMSVANAPKRVQSGSAANLNPVWEHASTSSSDGLNWSLDKHRT